MEVLRVLKEEGYISDYEKVEDGKQGLINITLRYVDKMRAITGIKRISKAGTKIYAKATNCQKY